MRTTSISLLLLLLLLPSLAFAGHRDRADRNKTSAESRYGQSYRHEGFLVVVNPNDVDLVLRMDDERLGVVSPGERVRFGPFLAGNHTLVTRFVDRERDLRVTLSKDVIRIDPRHPARIKLTGLPEVAPVTIRNLERRPVVLLVDGQVIGRLGRQQSGVFNLPTGKVVLEAVIGIGSRDRRRRLVVTQVINVDPFEGAKLRILTRRDGRRGKNFRYATSQSSCSWDSRTHRGMASEGYRGAHARATRR